MAVSIRELGRRGLLRGASTLVLGKSIESALRLPRVARADETGDFLWQFNYSVNDVPENVALQDRGWLGLRTAPGNTIVVTGGEVFYKDSQDREINFPGRAQGQDRASLVIVDGGTEDVSLLVFGRKNWVGVAENPGLRQFLTDAELGHLLGNRIDELRSARSGSGIAGRGVTGTIDIAVIDGPSGRIKFQAQDNPPSGPGDRRVGVASEVTPRAATGEVPVVRNLRTDETVRAQRGATVSGDVFVNGQKVHDDDPNTGLVVVFDQDAEVRAPFGATLITGLDDQGRTGLVADVKAKGCSNGCARVDLLRWPTQRKQG